MANKKKVDFAWTEDEIVRSYKEAMNPIRQIGVLADGTVVPCCLDHDGDIALGTLFSESMEDILQSPRAKAIYEGFLNGKATEPLCRRCGYAHMRFGRE